MKTFRVGVICALLMLAGVGCGNEQAEESATADQEAARTNAASVAAEMLENEPLP